MLKLQWSVVLSSATSHFEKKKENLYSSTLYWQQLPSLCALQNTKSAQETELYTGEYLIVSLTLWLCIEWYFHDSLCLRRLYRLHVDAQSEARRDSRRLQPVTPPSRSSSSLLKPAALLTPVTSRFHGESGKAEGGKMRKAGVVQCCRCCRLFLRVCSCVDGMWMSLTRGVRNEYVLHNDYKCGHSLLASLLPWALFCWAVYLSLLLRAATLSAEASAVGSISSSFCTAGPCQTRRRDVGACWHVECSSPKKAAKVEKKKVILDERRLMKEQCDLKRQFSWWGSSLHSQSQRQLCFFSSDSAGKNGVEYNRMELACLSLYH